MSMLAARLSVTAFTKRLSTAALPSAQLSRSFVKVGDKVPVNYLKGKFPSLKNSLLFTLTNFLSVYRWVCTRD